MEETGLRFRKKIWDEILYTLRGFREEGAPRSVLIAGSSVETRFVDRELVAMRRQGTIQFVSGVYYANDHAPKDR